VQLPRKALSYKPQTLSKPVIHTFTHSCFTTDAIYMQYFSMILPAKWDEMGAAYRGGEGGGGRRCILPCPVQAWMHSYTHDASA